MKFVVPHRSKPWSAKKLEKRFPHICEFLDGKGEDACLLFFYKFNSAEKIFEFIDADAEDEFADLLGVAVEECEEKNEDEELPPGEKLNEEQMKLHHENISMIRDGLKQIR